MSIADTVNTWFRERLASWPLGAHTEAYNQVAEALPDLIVRLGGAPPAANDAGGSPVPAEPDPPVQAPEPGAEDHAS